MNRPFTEEVPVKNATDFANRTAAQTSAFFSEANEKYQISEKASAAAAATSAGISSLWSKTKALVKKNPQQTGSASEANAEETKQPQQ